MGVRIEINDQQLTITGADRKLLRTLGALSSYKVEGYYFAPSYRAGHWDGKEQLFKADRNTREYHAPIGLLDDYLMALKARDIEPEIIDNRPEPEKIPVGWDGTELRYYQLRAIKRVLAPGPLRGIGIVNMPIRSGKTKMAAGLIAHLKVRTLFVVPSVQLLGQTIKALSETLGMDIGQLGDGVYRFRDVTVATIQTLSMMKRANRTKYAKEAKARWENMKRKDKPPLKEYQAEARFKAEHLNQMWKTVRTTYGLLIMDECHHLTADDWRKAVMQINSRYRVGLSATAFPDRAKEQERGVIWLKACCGPVRIRVDPIKLTEEGFLTPGRLIWQRVRHPDRNGQGWGQRLKEECILANPHRNKLILGHAAHYVAEGQRVLIMTNRHSQVRSLLDAAAEAGLACDYLVGSGSKEHGLSGAGKRVREDKVKRFVEFSPAILIGTVLSEGVDIPEVEVAINAEGGKDIKSTIQRMRNLTKSEGKEEAIFIDFEDLTNKYFKSHSRARLKVYKEYAGLKVEMVEDGPG